MRELHHAVVRTVIGEAMLHRIHLQTFLAMSGRCSVHAERIFDILLLILLCGSLRWLGG